MKLFFQILASGLFVLVCIAGVSACAFGICQVSGFIVRRTRRKLPTAPDVDFQGQPVLKREDMPWQRKDSGSHGGE